MAITVTEPSPEQPSIIPVARLSENQGNLVHVLVHRESEEYQTDVEDGNDPPVMRAHGKFNESLSVFGPSIQTNQTPLMVILDDKTPTTRQQASDIKMPANENVQYEILNTLGPHPVISIRVDSPHESPKQEHPPSAMIAEDDGDDGVEIVESSIDDIIRDFDPEERIDVTLPRDTRDIFYDYPEEEAATHIQQQSGNQDHS